MMQLNEKTAKGGAILLVVVVGLVLAVIVFKQLFGAGKGIFEFLNLSDTKEEKENKAKINASVKEQNSLGAKSAFSPALHKNTKNAVIITAAKTKELVKQLWDSVGYVYDVASQGAAAIKQCSCKTQVSWLADAFNQEHGLDLLQWLENHYDTSAQREVLAGILTYVENLPLTKKL